MPPPLSPRQRKFVSEYLIDRNARRAAMAAGYSENGASVQGSRLLANANIAALVNTGLAIDLGHSRLTKQRLEERLSEIIESPIEEVKTSDIVKSIDTAAKLKGYYPQEMQGSTSAFAIKIILGNEAGGD